MTYNRKTVTVKIYRAELCDILIATASIAHELKAEGHTATKWESLHDKLKEQLATFDAKNGPSSGINL